MQMSLFIAALRRYFGLWFHKRNLIIVSEHKVKHIPISARLQFVGLVLLASGVCWASYSTGSLMAARSALKEQGQALRYITGSLTTDSNFTALSASSAFPIAGLDSPASNDSDSSFNDSVSRLQAVDSVRLFARVAFLEKQVNELQTANANIIQRVRDKTSGHIDDLENIIKQTGLSLNDMKKEVKKDSKSASRKRNDNEETVVAAAEGGPYIPADSLDTYAGASEMFSNLDELATLRKIVRTLPLSMPIKNAEDQSGFGHRVDPFTKHLAFHPGLDIAGPARSKIYSTADGVVTLASRNGMYGNCIDIDHGHNVSTRYGHLSEILVKPGQTVRKGDLIGIQGSTGRSTGPHLHYEVRYHNQPMNPKPFLQTGRYAAVE